MVLPRIALVATLALFATHAAAQCTPEPNTGCPGALPVQCQGGTQLGSLLRLTCMNNGRADLQMMVLGQCDVPSPIGAPFVCTSQPCNLGIALGISAAIDTGFQPIDLRIPADPGLVGVNVCAQCADFVLTRRCLTLSQSVRIVVQR